LAAAAVLDGCAAHTLPQIPDTHPASAAAAEAPTPARSATLAADDAVSRAVEVGHVAMNANAAHQTTSATTGEYACPMHPEVHSAKPGRCPQCGMALVHQPQDAPTVGGHDAH